jgi:hypothetical protein
VCKEVSHGSRYDERDLHEPLPADYLQEEIEIQEGSPDGFPAAMRVVIESEIEQDVEEFDSATEFIRITDDH